MTNEFEIKVLEILDRFVAYLPPEIREGNLVLFAAYAYKRDKSDLVLATEFPGLPYTADLVKSVYTGMEIGGMCFDEINGSTYAKLKNGSWTKQEHPGFETDLPNTFVPKSLEARTFDMLLDAVKTRETANTQIGTKK